MIMVEKVNGSEKKSSGRKNLKEMDIERLKEVPR